MLKLLIAVFFLLGSSTVSAGGPAMSKKDLWKNSNTIVKGTVTKVKCTGEVVDDYCGTMTGYRAIVKVDSVVKGEYFDTLNLNFYKYDYNKMCMGTSNTRHYEGEEAVYYLNCSANGCRFTNWNGIDYIKKSNKPLPKCRKRGSK